MNISIIVSIILLVILSWIDVFTYKKKNGAIPSMLTTAFMILTFILNIPLAIQMGLFAALLSMFLVDVNIFKGIPDIKVFIAASMTIPSFIGILLFAILFIVGLFITKLITPKIKRFAGIPYMAVAYLFIASAMLWGIVG